MLYEDAVRLRGERWRNYLRGRLLRQARWRRDVIERVVGRVDSLDAHLELVRIRRIVQRFFHGDEPLLKQLKQRLVKRLHAVLRRARGNRFANHVGLFFVDDVIANQSGGNQDFDSGHSARAFRRAHESHRNYRLQNSR